MATHRPARPDVGETSSLPDVRGMNFYVLMELLYRRYGSTFWTGWWKNAPASH